MALDIVGKPYAEGGRGPNSYDCWGVVMYIYRKHGLNLYNYPVSFANMDARQMSDYINEKKKYWVNVGRPQLLAVVLFNDFKGNAAHVGVCLDNEKFIHAEEGVGVCIDRIEKWKPFVQGYYMPTDQAVMK